MNKFQISETVNSSIPNMNYSNSSESLITLTQSINNNITSKIIHTKAPQETPLSTKGNVKSYCRIRPNQTIFSSLDRFTPENNNKTLIVDFTAEQDKNNPSKQFKYKYNFTEIFWTKTENKDIYEKVCKQSVQELFTMHKNALIFVYGITNSGKTYTVSGNIKTPGILQLSLLALFDEYKKLKDHNDCWQLTCTYIEIYNEEVYDLLSKDRKKIKIVGGGNKFYPQGCIIKTINKRDDFSKALIIGENNRTKAETNVNPYSSRSHSIFRAELSYQDKDGFCLIDPVSLCIVDLAGAERVSKSGVLGSNLKEAGNINSSLLVLKKCFDAMEANSRTNLMEKKMIVPVRESKLTMLFKEYFAAHQNISVICTINPDRNELMDIRSVLNFGAKAMKVKPVKSWIPTYNYSSSKEVSPNKPGSRDNSPFVKDNKKKYRLLTEKKYLEKKYNYPHINHYGQKSNSKENISKVKEDNYYLNSDIENSSKNKNVITSAEKIQNIKIIKNNKYAYNNTSPNILSLHNEKINTNINITNNSNNKMTKLNYEERIKCYKNPYDLLTSKTNNIFIKNSPSKEKLKLEQELKEKRDKEIMDKLSKNKEEIKNMVVNLFNKKLYYKNLEQNIDIYEHQCRNIDLDEVEAILCNNGNKSYSLKNPFNKNYEEDKHNLWSKTRQINITYLNVMKEKIFKNENNINISYKPSKKEPNLEIISNYNIGYIPEKNSNNDIDIYRGNRELIEELQLKLNNSDHDQTKIMEFLDKSFEQYNASQFKAYFGIGNSLVKRVNEDPNQVKEKEININKDKNNVKNDIEMIDKIDKAENDANINFNVNDIIIDFLSNEFNFKGKGKDINNNNVIKESSKENEKEEKNEKIDDNVDNENENKKIKEEKEKKEEIYNDDNDDEVEDNKNKKKTKERKKNNKKKNIKKNGKKKKKYESDSDNEKEKENESEKNEIEERKQRKQRKKRKGKKEKEEDEEEEQKEEEEDKEEEDKEEEKEESSKEEDSEEEKKTKKRKNNRSKKKKQNKKSRPKKRNKTNIEESIDIENSEDNNKTNDEADKDEDEEQEEEKKAKAKKKNKKKQKKNKKKKIESDIDSSDDISEENENIKPIKKKKGRSKKNKK